MAGGVASDIQYKLAAEARQLKMMQKPSGSAKILTRVKADCRHGFCQFWTTDHQHRLLDRVARHFPYAYYIAPRFTEVADLHFHCGDRTILANSIIVKLSDFPPAKRGSSCRHRVISPHLSAHNFVFSKPAMVERVSLRNELRGVWRDWLEEVPLAEMLDMTWNRFPRIGKARALKWARDEVSSAGGLTISRYGARPLPTDAPRMIAHDDFDGSARPPPTPRRPPWPTHLFRAQRSAALVRYEDKNLTQLLALAKLFSLAGLNLSLLQPSDKALENTDFYDEGR